MSDLNVSAKVSVEGKDAVAGLKELATQVMDTKKALVDAKAASKDAAAEMAALAKSTGDVSARAKVAADLLAQTARNESLAAAAAKEATAEFNALAKAQGAVATGAKHVETGTGSVASGLGDLVQKAAGAVGGNSELADSVGSVGAALSGMGGKIGVVGALLAGPMAAALLAGAALLYEYATGAGAAAEETKRAEEAARDHAGSARTLREAIDDLDKATGRYNLSTRETIRLDEIAIKKQLDKALALRTTLKAQLETAVERQNRTEDAGVSNLFGGVRISGIERQIAANDKGITEAEGSLRAADVAKGLDQVKAATDRVAAATQAYGRAVDSLKAARDANEITQKEYLAGLTAAEKDLKAAKAEVKDEAKASRDAIAAHNRELREAARDAKAYAKSLEDVASAASRATAAAIAIGAGAKFAGLKEADDATRATDRLKLSPGLAARVTEIDAETGKKAAKGFTASTLADAAVIGQAIGGGFGRAITCVAALGFGSKRADGTTGDFTGVGGRLETLFKPLTDTFDNGGKRIAGMIGQAAGGAATGSVISGIGDALGIKNSKVGASIGGALGSMTGIPGGEIIGSILGGLAGGLIGVKKGSTTISASGGSVSSSSTGNAAVQKATGAIGNTITDALQSIATQLGGSIGDFSVSIGKRGDAFRVDRSGAGKLNGSTVTGTASESEALSLALADALRDGAVKTSPRVQAALLKYADNVNKAVAEALKVKGLEDLLADRNNPFLATFRALETQLKQRVDVARDNGFDLVQIEKINGEDRAKALKDTLAAATGSVRNLLTDLTLGSGATGSPTQRLAGLTAERDRLTGLARAGDGSQLDAIATIVKQIDDLQKETFGSIAGFASGRADSVALLNDLIRQTEDRAKAAAEQARSAATTTVDKLTELNASADDQVAILADSRALLATIAAGLGGGAAGSGFGLAAEYGR